MPGRAPPATDGTGNTPRLARPADLPAIRRVNEAAYALYTDRMGRAPAPVSHDYAPEVAAGQAWVLGDPVIALIVLIPRGDSLLIENIAVEPAAQGRGLGRLLMQFAEHSAAVSGTPCLTLYTNEVMTENLAFYAALGYRETGRRAEDGFRRVFLEKALP